MLGMIVRCMQEMVISHFGKNKWLQVMSGSGISEDVQLLPMDQVNDDLVIKLFDTTCDICEMTYTQVCDLFGDYWVNAYAPKVYRLFFDRSHTARDFILQLNAMHTLTTASIDNASPPSFDLRWLDDDHLTIYYKSHRSLIDLAAGLIRGVGKHFNEVIDVSVHKPDQLNIYFKTKNNSV